MPPPAPSAAAAGSRSAIVGGTETGHHLLEIDGYSHVKAELPTGECIESCPFVVGGRSWRISFYPNGLVSDCSDFVSILLDLHESETTGGPVKARAKFSLLDGEGKPVPSHVRTTGAIDFSIGRYASIEFIRKTWLEASEHLKDDRFAIRCDIVVTKKLRTEERGVSPPSVAVPPPDLHRHLGDLLATRRGADVAFHVGGEAFAAHRCVLAARSPVFAAELFGSMKEGTGRSSAAIIRVDDMEPEVFQALLGFVYTDTPPDWSGSKQQEAAMAQHLLVAADRYGLERLKLICEDKLCSHVDAASVSTVLALADQHGCCGLKEECFRFLSSSSNLNAAMATDGFEHLATSCPSAVRELMSSIASRVPVDFEEAR